MLRKLIYYLIRILLSWRWTSVPVPSWNVHEPKQYGLLRLSWKVWHRWHVIDFFINDSCIALVSCAALHSEAHHYASTLSLDSHQKKSIHLSFFFLSSVIYRVLLPFRVNFSEATDVWGISGLLPSREWGTHSRYPLMQSGAWRKNEIINKNKNKIKDHNCDHYI